MKLTGMRYDVTVTITSPAPGLVHGPTVSSASRNPREVKSSLRAQQVNRIAQASEGSEKPTVWGVDAGFLQTGVRSRFSFLRDVRIAYKGLTFVPWRGKNMWKEGIMSTFKSWGDTGQDYPHSEDYCCPGCDWAFMKQAEFWRFVIGFSTALAGTSLLTGKADKPGGVVVECGQCFEKFWFHVDETTVKHLRMNDDRWPKDE